MTPNESKKYHFRLYVSGSGSKSNKAFVNLRQACDEHLKDNYVIEMIDVLKKPELAARDNIIVTPAILRTLPQPVIKIVGEIIEKEKLLLELDILEPDR